MYDALNGASSCASMPFIMVVIGLGLTVIIKAMNKPYK
jgi:hypothetical protein